MVHELGYDVSVERWERGGGGRTDQQLVDMVRRRLCLGLDRDEEIRALLARFPPPDERTAVTLWWDASAR